jgi:hypothetical protein
VRAALSRAEERGGHGPHRLELVEALVAGGYSKHLGKGIRRAVASVAIAIVARASRDC